MTVRRWAPNTEGSDTTLDQVADWPAAIKVIGASGWACFALLHSSAMSTRKTDGGSTFLAQY